MTIQEKLDTQHYNLSSTLEVIATSEAGDKLAVKDNAVFQDGYAQANVINVLPANVRQTLLGVGTSFTESSAFVLAHLEPSVRQELMANIYGECGANFSIARTHIGACDFCVEGKYSYAPVAGDSELENFDIAIDSAGFSASKYAGISDERFDLLPMIKEALAVKAEQDDANLRILASAWTAPAWMKDIEDWYIPGSDGNGHQGTGGSLKPEYLESYALYINKYLDAYEQEGVDIWGITPVNEPHGNNGQWESMHFSAESQNAFVKNQLVPSLKAHGNGDVEVLVFDHNRGELEEWADVIFADPDNADQVYGAAIHWYESTYKVSEDILEKVHNKYPNFALVHSEGCIDDLGKDAPEGILDPEKFKEENWFDNDEFWWNDHATDWAYTATWPGVVAEDHPIYTPVHRYARNIIQSFNHWVSGWIDWNIVLDHNGGPNHVGNFCGAPIMINTETGYVYYTPVYYVLSQLSRTIRPDDRIVETQLTGVQGGDNSVYACASINQANLLSVQVLNTAKSPAIFNLQLGSQYAEISVQANALQTIRVQL